MIHSVGERRQVMQEKLLKELSDFDYRHKRYHINYSIAIGHTPHKIDLTPMSHHIRKTDLYVILTDNTYAVILDCTDNITGLKTANNLLTHFQASFFSHHLYAAVVTVGDYDTALHAVHDLFYLLDYAIKHNTNNMVLECSQIIRND